MDAVNKIVPFQPAADVVRVAGCDWIGGAPVAFPIKQSSVSSERGSETNGCVLHAHLFLVHLAPLINPPRV